MTAESDLRESKRNKFHSLDPRGRVDKKGKINDL